MTTIEYNIMHDNLPVIFNSWFSVYNFKESGKVAAPESCGDAVSAEKFAFCMMSFVRNKVFNVFNM